MIVDSDVLIWFFRGNDKARKALERQIPFRISAVTLAELVQGARNKDELRRITRQLKFWDTEVFHIDESISVRATFLVEDFALSHGLRLDDALIAATTIENHETLLTANTKHYSFVPNLSLKPFRP